MGSYKQVRGRNRGPGTRQLVSEIGSELVQLAQTEVDLARAELASNVRSGRRAVVGLGAAAVATLVGVTFLLVSGVLGLAMLMPGWLAALVVAGVVFGVGAGAGYMGWQQRPRSPLTLTRKSLKEDWEWLKQQVG